jgi:hypothetical protein
MVSSQMDSQAWFPAGFVPVAAGSVVAYFAAEYSAPRCHGFP